MRFSTHFIQKTSCISFLCTLASGQGCSPAQGYCRVNPDPTSMGPVLKTLDPNPVDFVSFSSSGLDLSSVLSAVFFFFLIVCFLLPWVFVAARPFSSCTERGGHSSLQCAGASLQRLLVAGTGPRHAGLGSCGHGLSCSAARGIFLDQVSNLRPLHWQADSHMLSHQGCLLFPFLMKLLTGTHLI